MKYKSLSRKQKEAVLDVQYRLSSLVQPMVNKGYAIAIATCLSQEQFDGVHNGYEIVLITTDLKSCIDVLNRAEFYREGYPPMLIQVDGNGNTDTVVQVYGNLFRFTITTDSSAPIPRLGPVLFHQSANRLTILSGGHRCPKNLKLLEIAKPFKRK